MAGEGNRILECQLGAAADREMRGVRGIPDEHHVLTPPLLVAHAREALPWTLALMRCVREQRLPIQPLCKHALARGNRPGRVHSVEAGILPRALIAFDD